MSNNHFHEQQFFNALRDIFVGAKIEGESGFINLMRIKSRYYTEGVFPRLKKDIDFAVQDFPDFREELFDKLYTFFQRYFSESGSIYFRYTPLHQNIYEKVYTDDRDVVLFWKTHMLYYVKTDRIFKSLKVSVDDVDFYFDASNIEHKRANEKRDLVFSFREVAPDGALVFNTAYSVRGRVTKIDEILKGLNKENVQISDETLEKAFRVFEKQSEVDYFINKNARAFLEEQFDLWMYQYLFADKNVWSAERMAQLQALKEIAYKVIGFISQFEDELVKIWNKPKFVRNSHYIITLDHFLKRGRTDLLEDLFAHDGMKAQLKEWVALGMLEEEIDPQELLRQLTLTDLMDEPLHPKWLTLPLDTSYYPDLEIQLISIFDDLDNDLDGWLIHSENYQALNTLRNKFKRRIQAIYIDPPFNTGEEFQYIDKFQDSTWLSLMKDRLEIGLDLLSKTGAFWLHLDENANIYGKEILRKHFSQINEIIFNTNATKDEEADLFGYKSFGDNFILKHQTLYFCRKNDYYFRKLWKPNRNETKLNIGWLDLIAYPKINHPNKIDDFIFFVERWVKGELKLIEIKVNEKIFPIGDIWNDIYSFTQSEMRVSESFSFTSSQKPENLSRRIIQSSTKPGDLIADYFVGIGTTAVVAQKLNRKWLAIEMGPHISEFYETIDGKKLGTKGRLKWALFGDSSISTLNLDRRPHLTKDIQWEGGGFFKYYDLEQYEETLQKVRYKDADLFDDPNQDPYHAYVFLRDLKLLDSLELDQESDQVHFHPERLYPDIDLAETLSHLRGKWIKQITEEFVEFTDGEKMSLIDPDWETLKPMIWWR